jgi:hypothetical protein
VNLDPEPSNQLLLESDIFANSAAVDYGIGPQATGDDRPLRQDPEGHLTRQWLGIKRVQGISKPMTELLRKQLGNDSHLPTSDILILKAFAESRNRKGFRLFSTVVYNGGRCGLSFMVAGRLSCLVPNPSPQTEGQNFSRLPDLLSGSRILPPGALEVII